MVRLYNVIHISQHYHSYRHQIRLDSLLEVNRIFHIKYIENIGFEQIQKNEHELTRYVVDELLKIDNVIVYNPTVETGTIAFNIKNVHPHDAATYFDQENIALRAGHHCAQLITKWLECVGTLRACFYIYNDMEDAKKFVSAVKGAAEYFKEW